jgi:uncharacterized protein with von Willebrand factor type A (vWA) domain
MSGAGGGTLAANVMHFARLLRRAGLPVGPAALLAAEQALSLIDIGNRAQMRTALRTTMIHRHEQREVFDQAFALFWRDPEAARQAAAMALLEGQKEPDPARPRSGSRRVAEAFVSPRERPPPREGITDGWTTMLQFQQHQDGDGAKDFARGGIHPLLLPHQRQPCGFTTGIQLEPYRLQGGILSQPIP